MSSIVKKISFISLMVGVIVSLFIFNSSTSLSYADKNDAIALLNQLQVKPRESKLGYKHHRIDLFGKPWTDDNDDKQFGHNGCDTRDDILRRDMTNVTNTPHKPCKVRSGTLLDPYSGEIIHFLSSSRQESSQVQIDHIVPLSLAWQTGAQELSQRERVDLANDPLNLLAVKGSLNQAKGDSSIDAWIFPNKGYRCTYASKIIVVKLKYRLWVTQSEKNSLLQYLQTCPR